MKPGDSVLVRGIVMRTGMKDDFRGTTIYVRIGDMAGSPTFEIPSTNVIPTDPPSEEDARRAYQMLHFLGQRPINAPLPGEYRLSIEETMTMLRMLLKTPTVKGMSLLEMRGEIHKINSLMKSIMGEPR